MTEKPKARRLVGRRDAVVLGWIGEQYLVPRDVLAQLLGRASDDKAAKKAGSVTDTVVDRTLRRWRDMNLAHCRRFIVGESATVWPTRNGLLVGGLEYRASEPAFATLAHRHAVARVRDRIETQHPDSTWICERELRDDARGRRTHIPDGVVETESLRWAIEVELTPKSDERLREILRRLFADYDRVIYYATPRAAAAVRKAGQHRLDRGELLLRTYPLLPKPRADSPSTGSPPSAERDMATALPVRANSGPASAVEFIQATLPVELPEQAAVPAKSSEVEVPTARTGRWPRRWQMSVDR